MTEGLQTRGKRTERLQIMLNDDELGEIEDWRFIHRVNSRSSAIRMLIRLGLDASKQGVKPAEELPLGRPKA